jgi:hypothetical protein
MRLPKLHGIAQQLSVGNLVNIDSFANKESSIVVLVRDTQMSCARTLPLKYKCASDWLNGEGS